MSWGDAVFMGEWNRQKQTLRYFLKVIQILFPGLRGGCLPVYVGGLFTWGHNLPSFWVNLCPRSACM